MHPNAEAGYAQTRRVQADPRQIEAQLFLKFATAIETADPSTDDGFRALASAIHDNSNFWTTLAVDLADEQNGLPAELKAHLIRLAQFSIAYGQQILANAADTDRMALVRVNRMIAGGLRGQVAEAA